MVRQGETLIDWLFTCFRSGHVFPFFCFRFLSRFCGEHVTIICFLQSKKVRQLWKKKIPIYHEWLENYSNFTFSSHLKHNYTQLEGGGSHLSLCLIMSN